MATLREHLKTFHEHSAAHHDTLAKNYGTLAGLGRSEKAAKEQADIGPCLQKIADTHEAAADFHRGMMEECSKVTGDELNKAASPEFEKRLAHLENSLVLSRVSAVAPENPNLRVVTRTGQRQIGEARPAVPVQFEKLVSIEE